MNRGRAALDLDLERRVQTLCLVVIAATMAGFALHWLSNVLIPFTLAVFLALMLSPLVDFQVTRLRMPRLAAVFTTLLLGAGIVVLVSSIVASSVGQLAADSAAYQQRFQELLYRMLHSLPLNRLHVHIKMDRILQSASDSIGSALAATTNGIVSLLSQGTVVTLFLMFILFGSHTRTQPLPGVWGEIEARIKSYIGTKTLISMFTGVVVGSTLVALQVDLAVVFGLFAFLLNYVPSVGPIIATLLPLPVVLFSPNLSTTAAILAISIPATTMFLVGNALEPKLMSESLDLHPVVLLLALLLWGSLWGVVGMLMATPITGVMKILCERLELTRPVAHLLAGRLDRLMINDPAMRPASDTRSLSEREEPAAPEPAGESPLEAQPST